MAMEHPSFDDLSAHLDGELAPIDDAEVADHSASCDECHAALDQLRMVQVALYGLPRNVPTSAERAAWHDAVKADLGTAHQAAVLPMPPRRRRPALLPWVAAAAVAAMVLGLGIPVLLRDDSPTRRVAIDAQPTSSVTSFTSRPLVDLHCTPVAAPGTPTLAGPTDVAALIDVAARNCTQPIHRLEAGGAQDQYSEDLALKLSGLGPCLAHTYSGYRDPLVPIYAEPVMYTDQSVSERSAFFVLFLTTEATGTAPTDPLSGKQGWVMDRAECALLNVSTSTD